MSKLLDLSGIPTPQLREIRQILSTGVPASADTPKEEVNMSEEKIIKALEQEVKDLKAEKETWSTKESATVIQTLEDEKKAWSAEKVKLEEKASQVDTLTKELTDQKDELETLRKFKSDTDEAAEKAVRIKSIKSKLDEAELEADVEVDADYWLSMTEEILDKTIVKMKELKKGSQASASIVVPPVGSEDDSDARTIVSEGLKELKQERDKR